MYQEIEVAGWMRLHKDVQKLIDTHGYEVSFKRPKSGGSYDTASGKITGGSDLTWTGRGVFVNYRDEDVNGTTITTDDRKLLLQAVGLSYEPETGDYIDDTVQVITTQKIQSGSTVIGYMLQMRG